MATWVLYVDESGDIRKHNVPLKDGQTPLFTLTGLALPLTEWRNFDREYLALKKTFFKDEIHSLKKRVEYLEIKGNELTAPRNKDSRRRHTFLIKVCELAGRYQGKLFCVSVIKSSTKSTAPQSIYTSSLQIMAERFNIFLTENNIESGIIIADSTRRYDLNVASSYMSYVFGNKRGKGITRICEAPLFADSKLTAGLQMVDNLSSIIFTNHYYRYCRTVANANSYAHMQEYWDKIKALEFCSLRLYDNYVKYGFRICRHDRNGNTKSGQGDLCCQDGHSEPVPGGS